MWAPLGLRRVEQVRDEMAAFPLGENDDAAVYGLLRIRQGGLMRLSTDLEAESQLRRPKGILLSQVGIRRSGIVMPSKNLTTPAIKSSCAYYILDRIKTANRSQRLPRLPALQVYSNYPAPVVIDKVEQGRRGEGVSAAYHLEIEDT